jgi:hypothetical protein
MEVSEEGFGISDEGCLGTMPLVDIALVIKSDEGAGKLVCCSVTTNTCVCEYMWVHEKHRPVHKV